jgi:hypothetical protein
VKQLLNRNVILIAFFAASLLGGCGGESSRPVATGKASIMAVNAMFGSPGLDFLIEERRVGLATYKANSTSFSYDNLAYTFNFDALYAGDLQNTRIVSRSIDFETDQQYTLVATGTIDNPGTVVWELPQRGFTSSDTVFQAQFAHTSNFLGRIDVYFALSGVAPALGEQVATLDFGDISPPMDFETDKYVVTITTPGDPTSILFSSKPTKIAARTNVIVTNFDGDANDVSPIVVRGLGRSGGAVTFNDPNYPPTIQFLHAAMDLNAGVGEGLSDVYDDIDLTSLIVADHAFRDLTADVDINAGTYDFSYTPAGDTAVVSIETTTDLTSRTHYRLTASGGNGDYTAVRTVVDRRSIDTAAKLLYYQSTANYNLTDLYIGKVDSKIDDLPPFIRGVVSRQPLLPFNLAPGRYDIVVTEFDEKEILAGPFRLKVELGDVVDMAVFDTVDPAILSIEILSSN